MKAQAFRILRVWSSIFLFSSQTGASFVAHSFGVGSFISDIRSGRDGGGES